MFSKPAISGHVKVSFEEPEYTAQADGVGTLRLLEAILGRPKFVKSKFGQRCQKPDLIMGFLLEVRHVIVLETGKLLGNLLEP